MLVANNGGIPRRRRDSNAHPAQQVVLEIEFNLGAFLLDDFQNLINFVWSE